MDRYKISKQSHMKHPQPGFIQMYESDVIFRQNNPCCGLFNSYLSWTWIWTTKLVKKNSYKSLHTSEWWWYVTLPWRPAPFALWSTLKPQHPPEGEQQQSLEMMPETKQQLIMLFSADRLTRKVELDEIFFLRSLLPHRSRNCNSHQQLKTDLLLIKPYWEISLRYWPFQAFLSECIEGKVSRCFKSKPGLYDGFRGSEKVCHPLVISYWSLWTILCYARHSLHLYQYSL